MFVTVISIMELESVDFFNNSNPYSQNNKIKFCNFVGHFAVAETRTSSSSNSRNATVSEEFLQTDL